MNYELRTKNSKGFTLVEILIVTAILGILAAIVLPEFQAHAAQAKEAAAKESLRIYREAIERYAIDHDGVPPSYPSNNTTLTPNFLQFGFQLKNGGYISALAKNPVNGILSVRIIKNGELFPAAPAGVNGWIYKPETKEFRIDLIGTDSQGNPYWGY
jgi:prepilin-type N-terminal cleavage/methylation domain-containing protein